MLAVACREHCNFLIHTQSGAHRHLFFAITGPEEIGFDFRILRRLVELNPV